MLVSPSAPVCPKCGTVAQSHLTKGWCAACALIFDLPQAPVAPKQETWATSELDPYEKRIADLEDRVYEMSVVISSLCWGKNGGPESDQSRAHLIYLKAVEIINNRRKSDSTVGSS